MGTNQVVGNAYGAGISVPEGETLTIQGDGSLTAQGGQSAAGIGSGKNGSCGNIIISGGTVTATSSSKGAGIGSGYNGGSCGTITISGGTVTATGVRTGAGIGSSQKSKCGSITITDKVTSVTAVKGNDATYSIGPGYTGTCGKVTIGGTVYYDGTKFLVDVGKAYLATSPLVYKPEK